MTFSEEQVEWIVVEVIRRLALIENVNSGMAKCGASSAASELVLSDRLITLRLLEGRLTGIRRVWIPPRAVITPAVKDELKARKIDLVTSAVAPSPSPQP